MDWEHLGKVDKKDSISSSTSFLGDTYILLVELVVFQCENIDGKSYWMLCFSLLYCLK